MKQLFINLPVKDLSASSHFYSQLGFTMNPLFTFDEQKCMVWSEEVYLMLQTYKMSGSGGRKMIPDPHKNKLASFTLPVASIDLVKEMMESGIKAGGVESTPMIDEGFMQVRNIEDPDGHNWAIIFLDIEKFKEQTGK